MVKTTIITLLLFCFMHAQDVYPTFILKSKGFVNDFVYDNAKLYVANDMGSVEIFDLQTQQLIDEIKVPKEISAKQELFTPKVISVDRMNNKTLFVSTTTKGFRNVWVHNGTTTKQLITTKDKMSIKIAKFLDDNNYLFGTLGHEITLYNSNDNYKAYTQHVENSTFTDMVLSEDKKYILSASESGRVSLSETKTGQTIKSFESLNVDQINKIAYANSNLITAGQDRRVGVYANNQDPYYIKSDFIVYCTSINPSGQWGIYSSDENNTLQLFEIKSGKKIHQLIGHYAVPSTIKFINEKELFSAGYENNIFYWNLHLIQ